MFVISSPLIMKNKKLNKFLDHNMKFIMDPLNISLPKCLYSLEPTSSRFVFTSGGMPHAFITLCKGDMVKKTYLKKWK